MNWAIETIYIILSVSLWMPTDDRSEQNWTILYRGYSMIILWYLVYMILSLMIFILFIPPPFQNLANQNRLSPTASILDICPFIIPIQCTSMSISGRFFQCITKANINVQDFIDIYIYQRFAHENFCVMSYFEYWLCDTL